MSEWSKLEKSLVSLKRQARAREAEPKVIQFRHKPEELNSRFLFITELLSSAWLPRKLKSKDQLIFRRAYGDITFVLSSGNYSDGTPIGLPSGAVARKLFISLIDKAYRTQSPVVEFQSAYGILKETGFTKSAGRVKKFHEQGIRLATCRLEIYYRPKSDPNKSVRFAGEIFDFLELFQVKEKDQLTLFPNRVVFAPRFFSQVVQRSGFGYLREAIKKTKSPLAIDILLWATRRIAFSKHEVFISWFHLKQQFANSPKDRIYDFERNFERALEEVRQASGLEMQITGPATADNRTTPQGLLIAPLSSEEQKRLFRYNPVSISISDK